jgi:cytochrome P450
MGMVEMDPPDSLRLRRMLVPWFSAKAVELNSVHIRDMVTWCLDRFITAGRCDIVDDLANPLPALVTLGQALGVAALAAGVAAPTGADRRGGRRPRHQDR